MDTLKLKRIVETDLTELGYNLNSETGRLTFLADLTGTPLTSIINDHNRILGEIGEWVTHG